MTRVLSFVLFLALLPPAPLVASRHRGIKPLPPATLERVLIPMLGRIPEGDVVWQTEFWMRNDGNIPIEMFFPFVCQLASCPGPDFALPAGALFTDPADYPNGVFLDVESPRFSNLSYTLRIENVADLQNMGEPRSLRGAELPLVRESSFKSAIHLVNIPFDGDAMRKTLRVYALGTADTVVDVKVSNYFGLRQQIVQRDTLTGGSEYRGFSATPPFASIDLQPLVDSIAPSTPGSPLMIWVRAVDPKARIWAFVALTSPDTKQMTAITPSQ